MKAKNTMINSKYAMRLQLFGEGAGTPPTDPPATPPATPPEEKITLTAAELEAKLQAEADKRVTGALKTAQAKWEADYKQKLEAEKAEAAKLANMTAAEREKALLEAQSKAISEKEKAIALREMKLTKIDIFSEKKLPIKLVDFVQGEDADTVKANIDAFEKTWKAAIDEAVNERLKGTTPYNTNGGGGEDSGIAKQLIEMNKQDNTKNKEAQNLYFK